MNRPQMGRILIDYPLDDIEGGESHLLASLSLLFKFRRATFFTHPAKRSLQEHSHARKSE